VPVALNSGLFWDRRSILKRPGRILVEFLPAIEPGLDRRHISLVAESNGMENIPRAIPATTEAH
jgi:1-acyl-sn-glycerol-3-phosphate acyltransferase